jgi:hypothetical protein
MGSVGNLIKIRYPHLLPIFYRLFFFFADFHAATTIQQIENKEQVQRSNFNWECWGI